MVDGESLASVWVPEGFRGFRVLPSFDGLRVEQGLFHQQYIQGSGSIGFVVQIRLTEP